MLLVSKTTHTCLQELSKVKSIHFGWRLQHHRHPCFSRVSSYWSNPLKPVIGLWMCVNITHTKRITVLDDLRKGLDSVRVMGTSVIDLLQRHSQVQQLMFPVAKSTTEVSELRLPLKYDLTDESTSKVAEFFEKYLDELSTRGTIIILEVFLQH